MKGSSPAGRRQLGTMVADYMDKGFLENIIDMFKHDAEAYELLPFLLKDDRLRVRLGAAALLESLKVEDGDNVHRAVPHLLELAGSSDPTARGDAAYMLGIVAGREHTACLEAMLEDPSEHVRAIAQESLLDIREREG